MNPKPKQSTTPNKPTNQPKTTKNLHVVLNPYIYKEYGMAVTSTVSSTFLSCPCAAVLSSHSNGYFFTYLAVT